MQEFLTNNTVSCNLMSLTGYRTVLILRLLVESPKSNDEINDYFLKNQYIKEKFSNDTIRLYINSLKIVGCDISRADKSNDYKYVLHSHPFVYDIPKNQIDAIKKLYDCLYDKVDIQDLMFVFDFFDKLSCYIDSDMTKDVLKSISFFKYIDKAILAELLKYCENKNQIGFLYNSPRSGVKNIEMVADKLAFKSGKLYLWGDNIKTGEYSYFRAEKIIKITNIKIFKEPYSTSTITAKYQLNGYNLFTPQSDEKILEINSNGVLVEVLSKNKFELIQRILSFSHYCKVIEPESIKNEVLYKLKQMKETYE